MGAPDLLRRSVVQDIGRGRLKIEAIQPVASWMLGSTKFTLAANRWGFSSPEWEILNSSHPYQRLNSRAVDFLVEVPAGGETVISYSVRYSWPLPGATFRCDYGPAV